MASLSQLQTWLNEAEQSRHQLRVSGESMIMVGSTQRMYDLNGLDRYIDELRREIGAMSRGGTTNYARF